MTQNEREQRAFEIHRLIEMIQDFQYSLSTIDETLITSVGVDELMDHNSDIIFNLEEELLDYEDDDDFIDPAGGSGLHSHI